MKETNLQDKVLMDVSSRIRHHRKSYEMISSQWIETSSYQSLQVEGA
jgi:hypothetical protein